ncbi:MAG: serine/threonine-protein kinase [Polyangiaceae bacterium]
MQPAAQIGPGTTIDRGDRRLVVDSRIGEGGMGIVWRAWPFFPPTDPRSKDPQEPIALKVLRPQAQAREDVMAFFLTEIEALKKISHPNIVRFHEVFEWNGALVLDMEYVEGDTLEEVIARHIARARIGGPGALPGIPFRRAWYYFQQLLGALAATHALAVVHRDVKPSNILIRRDGVVKLTDFGIARVHKPGGVPAHEQNVAPGTGVYMSPEQVLSGNVDGRSDLYSAATVLYEMLSGRTPFSTENKSEFMVRQDQVNARPPPIRTWLLQAPPVLDALFSRALAKDPNLRFANAIEMGTSFREALGIPDSAEWRAQAEMAREIPGGQSAGKEQRMATLRDFLVKRYKTLSMTAP